jgi:hypothetical protein
VKILNSIIKGYPAADPRTKKRAGRYQDGRNRTKKRKVFSDPREGKQLSSDPDAGRENIKRSFTRSPEKDIKENS